MYNFIILNGRCCLERRQCESGNEVKSNVTPLFCRDLCYYLIQKRCYRAMLRRAQLRDCISFVPVSVLGKKYWGGGCPLIIWEATTSKRNYYREPIKKLGGLSKIWGACAPWPKHRTATGMSVRPSVRDVVV